MIRCTLACLLLVWGAPAFTQPHTVAPGDIRCPDCTVAGQRPPSSPLDLSQIEYVPNPLPAFFDGRTLRTNVIARVLHPAPLVLEIIDSRNQIVDRNRRVLSSDPKGGSDPGTCSGPTRIAAVDLAARSLVPTLRLNDIVTGDLIMSRNEKRPDDVLSGTPTLVEIRKVETPIPFFHREPIPAQCLNRSGRLVDYVSPQEGEATVVFNDGGVFHRDAASVTFTDKLSGPELSELLRTFRDVSFDAMPAAFPELQTSGRPTLALIAARYQPVMLDGATDRLRPVLERLEGISRRATSQARYVLKRGRAIPLVLRPWPYTDIDLEAFVDPAIRFSSKAPETWGQRVPDDLLMILPTEPPDPDAGDAKRALHFTLRERWYRVLRPAHCRLGGVCTFKSLDVAEVTEPLFGDCAPNTTNCQTMIFPDGRRVNRLADPHSTARSGRRWPQAMNLRLQDVPEAGLTITRGEYERQKPIYFELLKNRLLGAPFIDDGFIYEEVRLCKIEAAVEAKCDLMRRWPAVVK
jgi:hypothetical protein